MSDERKERQQPIVELNRAFADGSVFSADDDTLRRYLKYLCTESKPMISTMEQYINRGMLINSLMSYRFFQKIEKSNKHYSKLVILLSIVAICVSIYTVYSSQEDATKMDELIKIENSQLKQISDSKLLLHQITENQFDEISSQLKTTQAKLDSLIKLQKER